MVIVSMAHAGRALVMLHWTQLLGFRPKHAAVDSRQDAQRPIRILAITTNDRCYSGLVDIAAGCGWEIRRASSVKEGLDVVRSLAVPLVLFDWDENGNDWRAGIKRIASAQCHPCVLLASR